MAFRIVSPLSDTVRPIVEKMANKRPGALAAVTTGVTVTTVDDVVAACRSGAVQWSANGWFSNEAPSDVAHKVVHGDDRLVAEADKMMAKVENLLDPVAPKSMIVDDVAGGVPNIPALLACQPLAMRRRQRIESNEAPIRVFVDLTSSGGCGPDEVRTKGIAVLALVRVLAARRPVELYVSSSLAPSDALGASSVLAGQKTAAEYVVMRVDTAPLDLTRAVWLLTSQGFARGYGYETVQKAHGAVIGAWNFSDVKIDRAVSGRVLAAAVGASADDAALYVPGLYLREEIVTAPEEWIRKQVRQLLQQEERADEEAAA